MNRTGLVQRQYIQRYKPKNQFVHNTITKIQTVNVVHIVFSDFYKDIYLNRRSYAMFTYISDVLGTKGLSYRQLLTWKSFFASHDKEQLPRAQYQRKSYGLTLELLKAFSQIRGRYIILDRIQINIDISNQRVLKLTISSMY